MKTYKIIDHTENLLHFADNESAKNEILRDLKGHNLTVEEHVVHKKLVWAYVSKYSKSYVYTYVAPAEDIDKWVDEYKGKDKEYDKWGNKYIVLKCKETLEEQSSTKRVQIDD